MTDETTTRTRRRVRVRPQSDQATAEGERQRAGGRGSTGDARTRTRTRAAAEPAAAEPAAAEPAAAEPSAPAPSPAPTAAGDDATVRRRRVRKRDVTPPPGETDGSRTEPDAARDEAGDAEAGRAETARTRAPGGKARSGGKNGSQKNGNQKNGGQKNGGQKAPRDREAGQAAPARPGDDGAGSRPRRQRNRKNRRKTGSTPRGGVSEETRRAITEGPPRRMLVSVGPERTEVAVLEERDLVEHYVTRKENESYVGNIYLGRVQNVLPGMEAAFVDIGKGRNGVLYAGEVNYDDEDLESKAPRIEQALKPGQTVVVQVTKDPMGTKGARLTQQLSLAGRYCVLAIEDGTVGISRKLTDAERDRLRETLKEIKPDGYGLIVRTAASGATREQLEADVKRLVHRWEQVQGRLENAKALTEVYREPDLAMRVIRDVFGPEYRELICDDEELSEQIREYLHDVSPDLTSMVTHYEDDQPLFDAYEITNQVRRALEKKVWLSSGGYLIIEKTEAMWVIDVNTGKFVGDSNLEETVLKNNLEAAEEIARQLRLRDMGGIIVIDFVDMLLPVNRDEVLKRFKRELARDKTKSRVMEISKLGLVQMTRKNVSQGLTETFTKTCECCEGRGAQIVDKRLQR
jgi:Rne/Rng family ribonuclease